MCFICSTSLILSYMLLLSSFAQAGFDILVTERLSIEDSEAASKTFLLNLVVCHCTCNVVYFTNSQLSTIILLEDSTSHLLSW